VTPTGIPYLPTTYTSSSFDNVVVHHVPAEDATHVQMIAKLAQQAMGFVQQETSFIPSRQIHICLYHTNAEAQHQLQRNIPPTMAMVPFSGREAGLIVLQSPDAHPLNGERERMLRLLAHECTHLVIAETTGSLKVLGDGNRSMRISTWINEGFAELLGHRAIGAIDRLEAAQKRFRNAKCYHSFKALSDLLDGLDHPARSDAFDHATAAVNLLVNRFNLEYAFPGILSIDRACRSSALCTPQFIQSLELTGPFQTAN